MNKTEFIKEEFKTQETEFNNVTSLSLNFQSFILGTRSGFGSSVGSGYRSRRRGFGGVLSGISLLPLIAACNQNNIGLERGSIPPVLPSIAESTREYDTTYNPDKIVTIPTGTGQEIITAGLGPRDYGSASISKNYGSSNNKIIALGITKPGQYKLDDLKDVNGADLSYVLSLDEAPNLDVDNSKIFATVNANNRSNVVAEDVLDGGGGNDTLIVYGQVAFTQIWSVQDPLKPQGFQSFREKIVTLKNIENIYVQSGTIIVSGNYFKDMEVQKIQGNGKAILWFKAPIDETETNRVQRITYQKSSGDEYQRFHISNNTELQNYVIDLRNLDIGGFDRIHIDKGTTLVVDLDVVQGKLFGVLKDVSMITGEGVLVFVASGNQKVPDLSTMWISQTIDVLIAGDNKSEPARREPDRGNSSSLSKNDLFDEVSSDRTLLKTGLRKIGGDESQTMIGSQGDDQFWGKDGDDSLQGREGNDQLSGGIGKDKIVTGEGNDIIFGTLDELHKDTIFDLTYDDRIKLLGTYDAKQFNVSLVDEGGEKRLKVDTNGDGDADFHIVLATPTPKEIQEFGNNSLVHQNPNTHFEMVQTDDGVLIIPTKLVDNLDSEGKDINQAPVEGLIALDGPYAVKENHSGALVGKFRAIDPDSSASPNGRHGYRLIKDDKGYHEKFEINKEGVLKLKGDQSLDFEQQRFVKLFIEVFDNPDVNGEKTDKSKSKIQILKVLIEDVNEAPVFEKFSGSGVKLVTDKNTGETRVEVTIDENTRNVLTFQKANDPDFIGSIRYSLEGRNKDLFKLDPLTRNISFIESPNYEAQPGEIYQIRLVATDFEGESVRQDIIVNVRDVNEAPEAVNPLKAQWIVIYNDEDISYDRVLGLETIFRDPELEEKRKVDPNTPGLSYTYQVEGGGNLPWLRLNSPTEDGKYGMNANLKALESLYSRSDLPKEFKIIVIATDQSGLQGRSSFSLFVTNNRPPELKSNEPTVPDRLEENAPQDSNRRLESRDALPFLDEVIDPEKQAIKIQTKIPILDENGDHARDAGGNYLYYQRYWGKYGYLEIRDVDLRLNKGSEGNRKPNEQTYSYYLVSDPEDIVRAKVDNRDALAKVLVEGKTAFGIDNVNRYLLDVEQEEALLKELLARANSLREGSSNEESISINIEDYGISGDGKNPSFNQRNIKFKIAGKNDAPTAEGSVRVAVKEARGEYEEGNKGLDPTAISTGVSGSLMENVKDIDDGDILEVSGADPSLVKIKKGVGTLTIYKNGSYRFVVEHRRDTETNPNFIDRLSEGEIETFTFDFQVTDGKGGLVDNSLQVDIIGRNDAPVFSEDILNKVVYKGVVYEDAKPRFSETTSHTFNLLDGVFTDVDKKDILTYSYTAKKVIQGGSGSVPVETAVDISSWFLLDEQTGRMSIIEAPTSQGEDRYVLTISVSDGKLQATGDFEFLIYKNTPPDSGTSLEEPIVTTIRGSAYDLTPKQIDNLPGNLDPANDHIIEGDTADFLELASDETAVTEEKTINVRKDDTLDIKIANLDVVPGSYKGKYGTLEVFTATTGDGNKITQKYKYTLDYNSELLNLLKEGEEAKDNDREIVKIKIQDKGGRDADLFVSFSVFGANDIPRETGPKLYEVTEKSSLSVDALDKVQDDDGDNIYIWRVTSDATKKFRDFDSKSEPKLIEIEGLYGILQVSRRIKVDSLLEYRLKYVIDDQGLAIARLTAGDFLEEKFIQRVGDRADAQAAGGYGLDQTITVKISGVNNEPEFLVRPSQIVVKEGLFSVLDIDGYVFDSDSTKIYKIEQVEDLDNKRILSESEYGKFIKSSGTDGSFKTNNILTFGTTDNLDYDGKYKITVGMRDTTSLSTDSEHRITFNLTVLDRSVVTPTPITDFNVGRNIVVTENNTKVTTEYAIADVGLADFNNYTAQVGTYRGKYGYLKVTEDSFGKKTISYYLDNLDPDTDALNVGDKEVEELFYDIGKDGVHVQRKFLINVEGVNDKPVVLESVSKELVIASGKSIEITKKEIDATVTDVDTGYGAISYNLIASGQTKIEGVYGTLKKDGTDYEYEVDKGGDGAGGSDLNPLRARLVKSLKEGDRVKDEFDFTVDDGSGELVNHKLVVYITGEDDIPELLQKLDLRFIEGGEKTVKLTARYNYNKDLQGYVRDPSSGKYVWDPDGDEVRYKLLGGGIKKEGTDLFVPEREILFDEANGEIRVSASATSGVYTAKVQIFNPLSDPIKAGGNDLRIIIESDTGGKRLDLLDEDLERTLNEAVDGGPSLPLVIDRSDLVATKLTGAGVNPHPLSVVLKPSSYGTYSIDLDSGVFTYRLNNDNPEVDGLQAGEVLYDIITYEVEDDFGTRDTRQIKLTIKGKNDKPTISLSGGLPLDVGGDPYLLLRMNDVNPDGTSLYKKVFSGATFTIKDPESEVKDKDGKERGFEGTLKILYRGEFKDDIKLKIDDGLLKSYNAEVSSRNNYSLDVKFKTGATTQGVNNILKNLEILNTGVFDVSLNAQGGLESSSRGYNLSTDKARYQSGDSNVVEMSVVMEDSQGKSSNEENFNVVWQLQGFNRFSFDGVKSFSKEVAELEIGFDGGKNEARYFYVSLASTSTYQVVSKDRDGDGIRDAWGLESLDLGGTEYVARTLKSSLGTDSLGNKKGGILGGGDLLATVENRDPETKVLVADGRTLSDKREFVISYENFTDSYLLGTLEADDDGNIAASDWNDEASDLVLTGTLSQAVIYGGGGNDDFTAVDTQARDNLNGGNTETLFSYNNTIYGGAGDDKIFARGGADSIYGGSGNDEIRGGRGNDYLIGGRGLDKYIWKWNTTEKDFDDNSTTSTAATDRIYGMNVGEKDIIDLSEIEFEKGGVRLSSSSSLDDKKISNYIRVIPSQDGIAPTVILIDRNGDGITDQEINLYEGDQVGTAPDILVPQFIKKKDVNTNLSGIVVPDEMEFYSFSVNRVVPSVVPDTGAERLREQKFSIIESKVGAQPVFEIVGKDRELFELEKVNDREFSIYLREVATVESLRQKYILMVKGNLDGQIAYSALEVNLSNDSLSDFVIKTQASDKVLVVGGEGGKEGSRKYLLFDGDDVFGTGSLGNSDYLGINNEIYGGAGNDRIFTGDLNDIANGGSGEDIIWSGLGNDTIDGGSDNDLIFSDGGNDIIIAGKGEDVVVASSFAWIRDGDSQKLRALVGRDNSSRVEVTLGEGVDTLKLERGGAIRVEVSDKTFVKGDKIDLSDYIVLPTKILTGIAGVQTNLNSYIKLLKSGNGYDLYIDRDGLGHFGDFDHAEFASDAQIRISEGKDIINLGIDIGSGVQDLLDYEVDDSDKVANLVSAHLREENAGQYGLYLMFDQALPTIPDFYDASKWSWDFSLANDGGTFNKDFKYSAGSSLGIRFGSVPTKNVPESIDVKKTLYFGFSDSTANLSSEVLNLDLNSLSRESLSFTGRKASDFYVRWMDSGDIDFKGSETELEWSYQGATSWGGIEAKSLAGLSIQYKLLGTYAKHFSYDGVSKQLTLNATGVDFDLIPREIPLTLVAMNSKGVEGRHDFIVKREISGTLTDLSLDTESDSKSFSIIDEGDLEEHLVIGIGDLEDFDLL